jgi:hypothetical protein
MNERSVSINCLTTSIRCATAASVRFVGDTGCVSGAVGGVVGGAVGGALGRGGGID